MKVRLLLLLIYFIGNSYSLIYGQIYQHLIIYGQSLSVGHQSWPPLSIINVEDNYMIGNQIWINYSNSNTNVLTPLVAVVSNSTKALIKTRSSMIYGECPLVAATNHIQQKTDHKYSFIASSCGLGGKTIEELSKEHFIKGTYGNFTNTIKYASTIVSSINCTAIFWMQGEYNYAPAATSTGLTDGSIPCSDKLTYKSLLLNLKNNMQNDILTKYNQADKPLFITYQTGAQYTRGKEVAIGMAQLEASNQNSDIVCAGPVYPMTDRGGHLDSNGYRWFGEMLGKVYYRTKILGEDFKPLQPIEVSRTENPRLIKLKYHVPHPPMVFDELLVKKIKDYGFEVYDDNLKKVIQNIAIVDDCILITTTTDLVGTTEVIYAGTNNYGDGNLRDSDDEKSYYNYTDLDKRNPDGSFYYERDSTETTLRPAYEPRDVSGVIYDKPYPLYNFSVAFYYKLEKGVDSFIVPGFESTTGNINPPKENISVSYNNNILLIHGLKNENIGNNISVINMNGTILFNKKVTQSLINQNSKISLHLDKGTYVLKVGNVRNETYRFINN